MPTGSLPLLAPLLLLLLLSAGSDAMAEERVLIRPEGTASQIAVRGKIVDYTGESVTILTGVGNVTKTYPIDSIVQVEMQRHPLHTEGAKLLAEGKINEATIALLQAHQQEPRQWVRREILALLVEAGLRSGDLASAASRFSALYQSDPTTRHVRLIPLTWSDQTTDPAGEHVAAAASQARRWLTSRVSIERLMGASLLLTSPVEGASAAAVMEDLARDAVPTIHLLARAQQWRVRLASGQLTRGEASRWEARVEEMPSVLRAGPYFLVGQAYLQLREFEQAASAFLRLPTVHPERYHLAAEGCLKAGDALWQIGQRIPAIRLYQEVVQRFPESTAAATARSTLASTSAEVESSTGVDFRIDSTK